jgi:hypothetical protein
MATWGDVLTELNAAALRSGGVPPFDIVRRKYLENLRNLTQRNTILYAANFLTPAPPGAESSIILNDEDMQGFMEVVHGLTGDTLDLILHSPGGSAEATESIVVYLRQKFTHIRVIVPHLAMSAATMLSCAADEVVMGRHSSLGPTDPQLLLPTPMGGMRMVPAQAIKAQFERARIECANQQNFPVWAPILPQYGPDLLETCDNVCKLSEKLVGDWLTRYMFGGKPGMAAKSKVLADFLNKHASLLTHSRHLDREQLRSHGMNIVDLETPPEFQDAVLSVFHATNHTLHSTGTLKIIENHLGRAWVKTIQRPMMMPFQFGAPGLPIPTPPSPP